MSQQRDGSIVLRDSFDDPGAGPPAYVRNGFTHSLVLASGKVVRLPFRIATWLGRDDRKRHWFLVSDEAPHLARYDEHGALDAKAPMPKLRFDRSLAGGHWMLLGSRVVIVEPTSTAMRIWAWDPDEAKKTH